MNRRLILRTPFINLCISFALVFFAGCANVHQPNLYIGIDGKSCPAVVIDPPAGLVEVSDAALLQSAQGSQGEGKLCAGKVFVVEQPVMVYRVWDKSKSYTALGRWWSLSYPNGSRENYRKVNNICPTWSALDTMSVCVLRIGTRVVIGTGQSVECAEGLYPQSAVNQVYIPNDTRSNNIFVEDCASEGEWPSPGR